MDYDHILLDLGEFGPWQRRNTLLLGIPFFVAGLTLVIPSLAVMEPRNGFRCKIEACDGQDFKYRDFAPEEMFPSLDPNNSARYNPDQPNYCENYPAVLKDGQCIFNPKGAPVGCKSDSEFVYAAFQMEETIATDNNLVCSNYPWVPFIDSSTTIGILLGAFITGPFSDAHGRRHTLLLALACCAFGNLLGCLSSQKVFYAFSRVVAAAGGEGALISAFTLTIELCGVQESLPRLPMVKYSTFLGSFLFVFLSVGEAGAVIIATMFGYWRHFQLIISVLMILPCFLWFILPESPRWLISQRKYEEAQKEIEKAAEENNAVLAPDAFHFKPLTQSVENTEYCRKDLFCKTQLSITLTMFICWPVILLLYFGLTLSADKIRITDNIFLSFILVCLIEVPAFLLAPILVDSIGRNPVFALSQIIPGLFCFLAVLLRPGTCLYALPILLAKLGAAAAVYLCFMYTAELFPTTIRNTAVGSCSAVGRVGGVLAPWVGKFLPNQGYYPQYVTLCVFGGLAVVSGLCALQLPETVGQPLPANFEDVERMKAETRHAWRRCRGDGDQQERERLLS